MATPTKYNYPLSAFPNGRVDSDSLTEEIQTSSISVALSYINTTPTDCTIVFDDVLSAGDKTTLDGIVATSDGNPLPVGVTPGAASGSGATAKSTGDDHGGTLIVMTGTSAVGNDVAASIKFNIPYTYVPTIIILGPGNDAAAMADVFVPIASVTATGFDINVPTTALDDSTEYIWAFQVSSS